MNKGMLLIMCVFISPFGKLRAQDAISLIIKEGITKVIKAVDLKIQRLQTKTIWLQNAQKVIENTMSKTQLGEITDWAEKQRMLYRDYFEELQKVKTVLTFYHTLKEITDLQLAIVKEYKRSFNGIKQDHHFSADEVSYIGRVYSGIIDESLSNLDGLPLVMNSFTLQMSDEKRMEIIDSIKNAIQKNYDDLKTFSTQNIQLSLARAADQHEISLIRALYGLR